MRSSSALASTRAFVSSIFTALRKADARFFKAASCKLIGSEGRSMATALRA